MTNCDLAYGMWDETSTIIENNILYGQRMEENSTFISKEINEFFRLLCHMFEVNNVCLLSLVLYKKPTCS